MKKEYIKPRIEVIKVENPNLLCSSSNGGHHHGGHHRPHHKGDCKDPWRPEAPWDREPWRND